MLPVRGLYKRLKSPYGEPFFALYIPRDGALYEDPAPGLTLMPPTATMRDNPESLPYGCAAYGDNAGQAWKACPTDSRVE
ncbi:MAG: hypothetical protein HDS41_01615 [Bacteroides sp.]|nr:hypothetical protein [Bacteroides sp.]